MGGYTTGIGFPGLQVDLRKKQAGYSLLKNQHVAQIHAALHIDFVLLPSNSLSHTIIILSSVLRSDLAVHLKLAIFSFIFTTPIYWCVVYNNDSY